MNKFFKDSGIKWIGVIPEHWSTQRVSQAFEYKKSKAKLDNPVVLSLTRDAVKVRDISNNEGQLAESYRDYNPVEVGDFILNVMDLYSGANCNVSNVEGVISPAYANLKYREGINPYYYDYFFKVQYWTMAMFAHGKGVSFDHRWTLNKTDLLKYEIPKIPFEEQNRIVFFLKDKLSKIDSLIKIQEKQIETMKEYKQSFISKIVTKGLETNSPMKESGIDWIGKIPLNWETIKMKYLGQSRNGLTYKPEDIVDEGEGTLVLRSSNVQDGQLVFTDNVYVRTLINDDLRLQENDILICSRNGSRDLIGKNALIPPKLDATFGAFMMIFRTSINASYVRYLLSSSIFSYYLGTFLTSTINQLTLKNFNNMIMVYTSNPTEQDKISNHLDSMSAKVDALVKIKTLKIEKLIEYKKALIYEYVTGKRGFV